MIKAKNHLPTPAFRPEFSGFGEIWGNNCRNLYQKANGAEKNELYLSGAMVSLL